jgi:D-3-phosphoglycerate dehydrogenase
VTIINFARGELMDNEALFDAIETGVVKRYITDFGTEELLNKEKSQFYLTWVALLRRLSLIVRLWQDKRFVGSWKLVKSSILLTNMKQAMTSPFRITLINNNVPNIVARISTRVSEAGINISNIINRSKDHHAYTLLDLEESDEEKVRTLAAEFDSSENIVRVRIIKKS